MEGPEDNNVPEPGQQAPGTRFSPGDRVRRRGHSTKQTVVRVSRDARNREMVSLEGEAGWIDERELDFVTDHERAVEQEQRDVQAPGVAGRVGDIDHGIESALRHDNAVLKDRLRMLRAVVGAEDDADLYRRVSILQAKHDAGTVPANPTAQGDGDSGDPGRPE